MSTATDTTADTRTNQPRQQHVGKRFVAFVSIPSPRSADGVQPIPMVRAVDVEAFNATDAKERAKHDHAMRRVYGIGIHGVAEAGLMSSVSPSAARLYKMVDTINAVQARIQRMQPFTDGRHLAPESAEMKDLMWSAGPHRDKLLGDLAKEGAEMIAADMGLAAGATKADRDGIAAIAHFIRNGLMAHAPIATCIWAADFDMDALTQRMEQAAREAQGESNDHQVQVRTSRERMR